MLSRDDIIRMAREAGGYHAGEFHGRVEAMERFAAAAYAAGAAAERDALKEQKPAAWMSTGGLVTVHRVGAVESDVPLYTAPQPPAREHGSVPMHITGPDGHSLRVQRSYWHEGVLCITTEAWPEPRTMTVEDLADCGLLSELDQPDGAGCQALCRRGPDGCADSTCPARPA